MRMHSLKIYLYFCASILILVFGLYVANFFGATRLAGHKCWLDLETARIKEVDYFLWIPYNVKIKETEVTKYAGLSNVSLANEYWILAADRPMSRRLPEELGGSKLLYATSMFSGYLLLNNPPDKQELTLQFLKRLRHDNIEDIVAYVEHLAFPR